MMPMTKKQLKHMERCFRQERRNTRYFTVLVDGERRTYRLSKVPRGERQWWATHHWDLGPRYRHARWCAVRVNTPYKSDHHEWVDGRAVTYTHRGRTRGEVLHVLMGTLRKGGVKDITVVR